MTQREIIFCSLLALAGALFLALIVMKLIVRPIVISRHHRHRYNTGAYPDLMLGSTSVYRRPPHIPNWSKPAILLSQDRMVISWGVDSDAEFPSIFPCGSGAYVITYRKSCSVSLLRSLSDKMGQFKDPLVHSGK